MQANANIFAEIVDPPSVQRAARSVESVEQARAWVTFMRTNPLRKTSPVGWSLWYLDKHPNSWPPGHKPERQRTPHFQGKFAGFDDTEEA